MTARHVGRHGVLVEDAEHGLHLVSDRGRGLTPDGAVLAGTALESVAREAADHPRGRLVVLAGDRATERLVTRDLRLGAAAIHPDAVREFAAALRLVPPARTLIDPAPLRALGPDLVMALSAGNHGLTRTIVTSLIGAGPGATPTGDDVLVGVLAGLHAQAATPGHLLDALVGITPPLLRRTTAPSAHELRAALGGRFSERVHHMVRSLADPASATSVVAEATRWGATSGIDLASGLLAVVAPESPDRRDAPHEDPVRRCA